MKKIMIATGVAVLAVAMIASAQGYAFNTNLTVGSTGADVVALQTWLLASGYVIPALSNGSASKGYFGSQTKTAVMRYQAANGIPNTGFVGPLTRGALNGAASVVTVATGCPVGYTCTLTNAPGNTLPGTVVGAPAGINTPGVVGTLAASLWSTPSNGTTVYKSQSYDVATLKLQAGASDMAVQNLSVDFNDRMWLYAGAITVKDETGAVIGQLSNLSANPNSSGIPAAFTELTVGQDYRISIPVSNLVVRATQSKYLTVNLSFLSSSDRCSTSCTIGVTSFQVRSVDGTGVTDTETVANGLNGTTGVTATNGVTVIRSFSFQGTNSGNLVVSIDGSSPQQGQVSISTSGQTQDVLLAVYSVKPTNQNSTLRTLKLDIGNSNSTGMAAIFANLKLKAGGLIYSASTLASTSEFTNLAIPLPADVYTTLSIYGTVNQDTANALDGSTASTSILLTTTNVKVEDSTYNTVSMASSNRLVTSLLTFSAAAASINNEQFAIADAGSCSTQKCATTLFSGSFTVNTGNSGVYLSSKPGLAFATTSTSVTGVGAASSSISTFTTTNGQQGGDISGSFYYVGPNSSRSFNIGGAIDNTHGTAGAKTFGVTTVYFTDNATSGQEQKYNINYNLQGLNSDAHISVLLGS